MPEKVTLKIPRPLYMRLQSIIEGSDFGSVTEYVVFILRLIMTEKQDNSAEISAQELRKLKNRLQNLEKY